MIFCLCTASCSSSFRIFSSRLRQEDGGALGVSGEAGASAALNKSPAGALPAPYPSPRVLSLSTASSMVGAGGLGPLLAPKMRLILCCAPLLLLLAVIWGDAVTQWVVVECAGARRRAPAKSCCCATGGGGGGGSVGSGGMALLARVEALLLSWH